MIQATICKYFDDTLRTTYGEGAEGAKIVLVKSLLSAHSSSPTSSSSSSKEKYEYSIILNETIFHPQGGGQPADHGIISLKSYSSDEDKEPPNYFSVEHVIKTVQDGISIVEHLGHFRNPERIHSWTSSREVIMKVDESRRMHNARLHTAGHLLDYALSDYAGVPHSLVSGGKGYHFPDNPNIEIVLNDDTQSGLELDPSVLKTKLQAGVDDLIDRNLLHQSIELPYDEIPDRRLISPNLNGQIIRLLRLQNHEDLLLPCGGTHVPRTGLIGAMTVDKVTIKRDKNNPKVTVIKIFYNVKAE